jgi:hypothetical protein
MNAIRRCTPWRYLGLRTSGCRLGHRIDGLHSEDGIPTPLGVDPSILLLAGPFDVL